VGALARHFEQMRFAILHLGISQGEFTLDSNRFFKQFADTLAKMNMTIKSEELTILVHNTALFANNYQVFGQMASKLGGMYQRPQEFALNSVEAFYL